MAEQMVCSWCGQLFVGKRGDQLFCNKACKQKYWRWKHHLDLSRKIIMVEIDEVEKYLSNEHTESNAALVMGEIADRLAALGFVASPEQMALPAETYTISNQLGVENE
jgi:hypothetical protein